MLSWESVEGCFGGWICCLSPPSACVPPSPCALSDALGCSRVFGGIFGGRRRAEALTVVSLGAVAAPVMAGALQGVPWSGDLSPFGADTQPWRRAFVTHHPRRAAGETRRVTVTLVETSLLILNK